MTNERKQNEKPRIPKLRFLKLQVVAAVFLVLLAVMTVNQRNITYQVQERVLDLLEETERADTAGVEPEKSRTMLIWEEGDETSESGRSQMEAILSQMKVGYDVLEVAAFQTEQLSGYEDVVLAVTHLELCGEKLLDLMDWVKEGGNLMLLYPPENGGMLQMIAADLGISMLGNNMALVESLHFTKDFMIGGQAHDFAVTDPYESSLAVALLDDCEVYVESAGENSVPILWRRKVGEGCVVVDNLGFLDKTYRGIHCSAYSLLGDCCVWPVINAAVFYIDDFPSPVPGGEGKYISRDYGMDIKTFYTQVWWRDTLNLAKEYGIRYTGLVIEQYSDQVEAPFERNGDVSRYQYFGNMLLDAGGEIGFHGYNHMPLCLKNFDYQGQYDSYNRWESYEDMKAGLSELASFCASLYPEETFQVYVPPSNILSEEGRRMLAEDFPQIKAIASVYLPGDLAYEQEFEVADDGIVETPRVISGYIMGDYTQLTALCELNFHYVSSHFQHPDDVLDEDRGAALGWNRMYQNIVHYAKWLYEAAPGIRNLTGSEMAGAVQRYDRLQVERKETEEGLELKLGEFTDEAWLFLRINEGTPAEVTGGELTRQTEDLYLLKAEQPHIQIRLEKSNAQQQ